MSRTIESIIDKFDIRKHEKYVDRKYEYFKTVLNKLNIEGDDIVQVHWPSLNVCLNEVEGFEDVSFSIYSGKGSRFRGLIERYNKDEANKYLIVDNTYPYLIRRPNGKVIKKEVFNNKNDSNQTLDLKSGYEPVNPEKLSRREYCVSYVINKLVDLFKINGDGYRFDHNDLVGKIHSEGNTEWYVSNSFIAESKRLINSNPGVYKFRIKSNCILEQVA